MTRNGDRKADARSLVLVVHASAAHARPVETLLEGAGYEVVSASAPDETRMLIEYGRPDVIVIAGSDPALDERLAASSGPPVLVVADGCAPEAASGFPLYCSLATLLKAVSDRLVTPANGSRGGA